MENTLTAKALFEHAGIATEDAPDGIVTFMDWKCNPKAARYTNGGRRALALYDVVDGEPVATVTVNLPEDSCDEDEIFVKDYSENTGMVTALLDAKLVERPHRYVRSGFVSVPVCRLNKYGKALWEDYDA